MIVMKFGGSSVLGAERILRCVEIVRRYLDRKPVTVFSAFRGVTDALIGLAHDSVKGRMAALDQIREKHLETINRLGLDQSLVKDAIAELEVLTCGISMVKELTPRTVDYAASFGERMSARIIAAAFEKAGIPARAFDAYDAGMLTDDNFGGAHPLPEAEAEIRRHLGKPDRLPVVTGYIGKTTKGEITTLGRNGSDYTATILGGALGAKEVQIWTDVDGIMTADPALVSGAKSLESITFAEASELAYYGGRVLHPATLLPAVRKGIPVRVLNTFNPDSSGTAIVGRSAGRRSGVCSIAYKRHQRVVSVASSEMLMRPGFLARIFEVFARHGIVIDVVSTSEVSVSVTTDTPKNLERAVKELEKEFGVNVEDDMAILCIVGEGLKDTPGVAGDAFGALKEAGVNVSMISQGASKINMALVVRSKDVPAAVRALHKTFFGA